MAPRAGVCQDSEDEDDEVIYDPQQSQQSTISWAAKHAEAVLAENEPSVNNFDGANDARPGSTSSSDLLGQIHDAQRRLFATASTASPAVPGELRRRVTATGNESNISPARSVKRTKTANMKTYGSKSSTTTAQVKDHNDFAPAFREETGAAGAAHPSLHTERLDSVYLNNALPSGTLQRDFMAHEPNVMFRDTGETNPFNESSQQRVMEQAKKGATQPEFDTTFSAQAATSDKDESSSFPWSASAGPTQSPNGNQPKGLVDDDPVQQQQAITGNSHLHLPGQGHQAEIQLQAPDNALRTRVETEQSTVQDDITQARQPFKSSPVVEIPRYEGTPGIALDETPLTTQKAAQGRKRKSRQAEDEEQLDSDDPQIGLPKEQYKPRPSRRRATEAVEQIIDYSVVPERAARKRRKTADNPSAAETHPDSVNVGSLRSPDSNAQPAKPVDTEAHRLSKEPMSPTKPDESSGTLDGSEHTNLRAHAQREHTEPPPSTKKSVNAKAMAPPPVPPASSRKGRRSKTTIFEDHAPSPSLSQQQEMRKSVLEDSPLQPTQVNRRKRRTILQEEEDDEDELARPSPQAEEAPPKKRGKAAKATKKAKSTQRVIEDSEDSEEDLVIQAQDETEPSPKKPGRGRRRKSKPDEQPNKAVPPADPKPTSEKQSTGITSSEVAAAQQGQSSPSRAALQRKSSNLQLEVQETTEETPQPAKEITASPQKATPKPSPTSHSPLKSSSLVPHRVGLSRKNKIPSLLKSFRPPPKQSTR